MPLPDQSNTFCTTVGGRRAYYMLAVRVGAKVNLNQMEGELDSTGIRAYQ